MPQNLPPTSLEADFTIEYYGAVFLVRCHTDSARQALVALNELNAPWFGHALVVEPRFIGLLVSSLRADGWTVR
jgi:hypothetical protein